MGYHDVSFERLESLLAILIVVYWWCVSLGCAQCFLVEVVLTVWELVWVDDVMYCTPNPDQWPYPEEATLCRDGRGVQLVSLP